MKKNNFHNLSGEQKDQLLVLCDKDGNNLGTATREECHKGQGKTHLAFMAFLYDKNGKVILTKRSKQKSLWAHFWDASVVSHVLSGETPQTAANRRGKEELGVEVEFKDIGSFYYFAKHNDNAENEYCHVLVGKTDQEIYPNNVEIYSVEKISLEELKKRINISPESFTPWLKLAITKVKLSDIIINH